MKIKRIKIDNFRCFQSEMIDLNPYSCFVGPNGAGKSTVLAALNVFFQEHAAATDIRNLVDEDYFRKTTSQPIRITLTFHKLSKEATQELADYVRQDELVVTAEATFNSQSEIGTVKHYGQRLGMEQFRPFFEAVKAGANAAEITEIYNGLRAETEEIRSARSKSDKAQALREYEAEHPNECVLIPSEDNFYGINSTGKLARFVQWVYVPAVKDAEEEGLESKDTALGKLIARAVRTRTNFDEALETLKKSTLDQYQNLLAQNQESLTELSESLRRRLETWAHPDVQLDMRWRSDPNKSILIQTPVAGIKTGEGDFVGSLARMGHGLQRSYLLALLQELAGSDSPDAPTLILGCEEPELYQHPPQARHLANLFDELVTGNTQILVTTHSPLFVSGDGFENIRLVRRMNKNGSSHVSSLTFAGVCDRIRHALGQDPQRPTTGLIAKIHQALQPGLAEMFFAGIPVLVEGLEDVSYITTHLHLSGTWSEFRRLGCHLIPVNGKDKLVRPLAIAKELKLPVYVVFDADGNTKRSEHRIKHERDNNALITLLEEEYSPFPDLDIIDGNHAIWPNNLGDMVKKDFGEHYSTLVESARIQYGHEPGLEKHDLFIAEWLTAGKHEGHYSSTLERLCSAIFEFARKTRSN